MKTPGFTHNLIYFEYNNEWKLLRLGAVHILRNRGCWGGLSKWLQYYIGVVRQMITVLHRGDVANDYGITWILGYYIRNFISLEMTKKSDFFCW